MSILTAAGCNLISYPRFESNGVKKLSEDHKRKLQAGKKFSGEMSKSSAAKIRRYINIWLDNITCHNLLRMERSLPADRRMIMLTLTLSGDTKMNDTLVKRYLLNTFLTKLKLIKRDFLYIWKAERQDNGRIHFHILADSYFPKDKVSDLWNQTQMTYKIIPTTDLPTARKLYPSTKIEAIRSVDKGLDYMVKYICKNESKQGIDGRVWGCSQSFTTLKRLTVDDRGALLARLIDSPEVRLIWKSPDIDVKIYNMGPTFNRLEWVNHVNELGLINLKAVSDNYNNALKIESAVNIVDVVCNNFVEGASLGEFNIPGDVVRELLI